VEKDSILKRILEEEDFVHAPKYQNSLQKVLAKSDKILENGAIGRLLLIPEEEVERLYQESIEAFKQDMLDEE